MSDDKNGNGNGKGGVFGAITTITKRLTPEFIALLLLNVGILWLFKAQGDARERVLAPMLNACSSSVPIGVFEDVLKLIPQRNHGE